MALMLAATLAFTLMQSVIRVLADDLHPLQITFFRNAFGFLTVLPWLTALQGLTWTTARLPTLLLRSALNTCAMMLFFTAVSLAPMAQVNALQFSATIMATLLAVLFLREQAGPRLWAATLLGFAGAVVILQPGPSMHFGALYALGSATLWGMTLIVIKQLSRTETGATIVFYTALFMSVLSLPPALLVWTWPDRPALWGWLLLLGLTGTAAQLSLTEALRRADTSVVMPVDYMKLVWAMLLGFFLFGEIPSAFTWIGGVMVIGATVMVAARDRPPRTRGSAA